MGFRDTDGAAVACPVPLRATFCGLFAALSVIATLALRVPTAVGVKVTLMVQEAFRPKVTGQLFVSEKSPAFAPLRAMLLMFSVALPAFVRITLCAALVVPTTAALKFRLFGLKLASGMPRMKLFKRLAVVCCMPALA